MQSSQNSIRTGNIIVVPLIQRIADIERKRKENNNPGQDEDN